MLEQQDTLQTAPKLTFFKGIRDGIPICLGYLSVSFTFGMMVVFEGYPGWMAVLISMTNLTSAGQFAGTELLMLGAPYVEIAVTTFVINIRYMLMSLTLSQKVERKMNTPQRLILSFGITDEIFGVAMQQQRSINSRYFAGLICTPYFGWALGTLLGATVTGFLPPSVRTALSIAIYGMFLAIILPPAKKSKAVLTVVAVAAGIRTIFYFVPGLNLLSSGWAMIISAVAAAGFAAIRFPFQAEEEED